MGGMSSQHTSQPTTKFESEGKKLDDKLEGKEIIDEQDEVNDIDKDELDKEVHLEETRSSEIEKEMNETSEEETIPNDWKINSTRNGRLLDEDGNELERKLRLDDGEKRELMVKSVKGSVNFADNEKTMGEMMKKTEHQRKEWYPVNIGKTYISGNTVFNLFAAVPARKKGLGTVIPTDKEGGRCYLYDDDGHKFYMEEVGNQLRFKARMYDSNGEYKEVTLVHDTGAAANILRQGDAELWESSGDGVVSMGGFTGERNTLIGGNDLCVMLHAAGDEEECLGSKNNDEGDGGLTIAAVMKEIAHEEKVDLDELEEDVLLVCTRSQTAATTDGKDGNGELINEGEKNNAEDPGLKGTITEPEVERLDQPQQDGREEDSMDIDIEDILSDMTPVERDWVLRQVKSAKSLKELIETQQGERKVRIDGVKQLSKEMGLRRRVKVMKESSRKFPHLDMSKLNRMFLEGDIKGGIELKPDARVKDEIYYQAKGTRARIHRKHKDDREDPGKGFRAPFFMVEMDLIDLTNETKGNRWGYNWLLVIVDKEYGTLKVYPLRGKDDVKIRWRQFQQWINIVTPYVEKKLGVKPEVRIVGNDRGTEFMTTHGRSRGELDEELYRANIYRWSPTAGDSNKLGKVERMNRIIMENVNCMLRAGGATNEWTYFAVSMFEYHYNTTPTDSNIIGNGEAPYKTLGIPVNYEVMVRFMCPAYVRMPKNRDVISGKEVAQTKLTQKLVKCFIIGYGGAFSQGCDHDGYKVVIPASNEDEEAKVYSSNDVFPQEDMEITRSFLTGKVHDPLKEGKLVRRQFDIEGEETLNWKLLDAELEQSEAEQLQEQPEETQMKVSRRMTVGTGATGQMRYEMDERKVRKVPRNDVMTQKAARYRVAKARRKKKKLRFVEPDVAKKWGDSRKRYDIYWKCTTFEEYDELCKRKDQALKGDLVNDLQKGHLKFVDEANGDEDDISESGSEDDFEWGTHAVEHSRKDQGTSGDRGEQTHRTGFVFGLHSEQDMEGLRKKGVKWETVNLTYDEGVDDDFILEVCRAAKADLELGNTEVPLWLALAVYHRAVVYVDGRKQPYTVKEAMTLKEWPEWKEAVMKEIRGLLATGVWREIKRTELKPGTKVLPGRMVLEIKVKDGKFEKCKARYVSRGDLSNRGEHYYESSSHQVRSKSLKMFFATAVTEYADTRSESKIPRNLDISQAYLARKRTEHEPEVFMELPAETFGLCNDKKSGYVAKMLRHLYGEVDGGRAFERELLEFLDSIGAEATVSDRMVFKWKWNGHSLKALAHVDDIVYNGSNDEICDEFFRLAEQHFGKLTGGKRAEYILGIKIEWDLEKLTVKLSQRAHVEKFLAAFGFDVQTTKKKDTPMPLNKEVTANTGRKVLADEWDTFMWVGFANWLVSMTRVDMAGVTNQIGRHANNPGEEHVDFMKWALRYLAGTLDIGLTFYGDSAVLSVPYDHRNKLIGYVDSMHGAGADTMCVVIMLNGAAVIWKVLKQRVVTTSTAHSEMIALAAGARELKWATDFMAEMGHEQSTVRMLGDNQSANLQATGDYKSSKSDHYRRIQFYVEDNVNQGLVWIDKVATEDNVADIGTKQVTPIAQFQRLRDVVQGVTPCLVMSKKVQEILDGMYDKVTNAM